MLARIRCIAVAYARFLIYLLIGEVHIGARKWAPSFKTTPPRSLIQEVLDILAGVVWHSVTFTAFLAQLLGFALITFRAASFIVGHAIA